MNKIHGAIIVTRVSTPGQVEHGTSLGSQLESGRLKAAALNIPVVAEYEDAGISGAFLTSRQGMQQAIADIKAGKADTLICATLSRYSRVVEHQQAIRRQVRAAGGRLVFCDVTFDDTPEGDLNFTIQGGFAEYERKMIRKRTMDGKRQMALDGIQVARTSPYGYHIPTKTDIILGKFKPEEMGKYLIDPETAPIAKWIIESYAAGTHSMNEICKELNAKRVPTSKGAAIWLRSSLSRILKNTAYKGYALSGKYEGFQDEGRLSEINPVTGFHFVNVNRRKERPQEKWVSLTCPALVTEEVWNKVQDRLANNKDRTGGNPSKMKMLSGLVYCPECEAKMLSHPVHANRPVPANILICSRFSEMKANTGAKVCASIRYVREVVENAVVVSLLDACKHPEAVYAALDASRSKTTTNYLSTDPRKEMKAIDVALSELSDEESAIVQAQIAGIRQGASADIYASAFADLAARRKDLNDRRGQLSRVVSAGPDKTQAHRLLSFDAFEAAHKALTSDDLPVNEKRKIVGALVTRVVPLREGATTHFHPGVFGEDTVHSVRIESP